MYEQLMKKKDKMSGLSDAEREAKMSVLNHLRDLANEDLGGRLKDMKKVSVMSDSKEGLQEGLDKAGSMLDPKGQEPQEDEESPMHEMQESPEEESMEHMGMQDQDLDPDMIDQKIQELMALKEKLKRS